MSRCQTAISAPLQKNQEKAVASWQRSKHLGGAYFFLAVELRLRTKTLLQSLVHYDVFKSKSACSTVPAVFQKKSRYIDLKCFRLGCPEIAAYILNLF